jgi:hypothetical protein
MASIEALKTSNNPEDWEDIISIARDIDRRQEKIEPFLPWSVNQVIMPNSHLFVQTRS